MQILDLEQRFKNVTYEILEEVDQNQVAFDKLIEDIGINSLIFIQLIVAYEKEFNVEFDGEDLDFNNYSTLLDMLKKVYTLKESSG